MRATRTMQSGTTIGKNCKSVVASKEFGCVVCSDDSMLCDREAPGGLIGPILGSRVAPYSQRLSLKEIHHATIHYTRQYRRPFRGPQGC